MSGLKCYFLTHMQVSQEAGKVVWYSHLFQNFPQFVLIHTANGFSIVNEAEVDVFLEFPCFIYDPAKSGNLISGSSAFSKPTLYIWKFLVHVLPKRFFSVTLLAYEMSEIVQWFEHSLALPFFRIGLKTTFSSPVATAEFSKLAGTLSAAL